MRKLATVLMILVILVAPGCSAIGKFVKSTKKIVDKADAAVTKVEKNVEALVANYRKLLKASLELSNLTNEQKSLIMKKADDLVQQIQSGVGQAKKVIKTVKRLLDKVAGDDDEVPRK